MTRTPTIERYQASAGRRRPPRLRGPAAVVWIWALIAVAPLPAQQIDSSLVRGTPTLVKYGKWATLAAAIGMGIRAADAHHDADRAFDRLSQYCVADQARCQQSASGSYLDPQAERYYQSSLGNDRTARRWLLGGEITLLGTAGLFVWELTRPKHPAHNIPFEPTIRVTPEHTSFGLRTAF